MTSPAGTSAVTQPIDQLLRRLWSHIRSRRRWQLLLLLMLTVLASVAEIFSIGAVLPLLGLLTSPDAVFQHRLARPFIDALGIVDASQLLLPLTLAFGIATLAAGSMRLLLIWASTRLSFATGSDLSTDMYRRTLYQPYAVHLAKNSSQVINSIAMKANASIYLVVIPVLTIVSSAILMTLIIVAMLMVDPRIALAAFGGFGAIYAVIVLLTRKQLLRDSNRVAQESTNVLKALQEGLGGVRDVLIDGSQATYCRVYRNADLPLRRAQGNNYFVAQSPRIGTETLGMLLIAGLAFALAQQPGGIQTALPILGTLALCAQRLLPVLQAAYASWISIRGAQASLQDTLDLLDQPLPAYVDQPAPAPLPFRHHLTLENISFAYAADAAPVLEGISLTVPKGARVGFIGKTGSGKSTLLDIVMGLLAPQSGSLSVDGVPVDEGNRRAWQANIAHVPQSIFLADSTIAENIAFGVPPEKIDHSRVRGAAARAQLADAIESWPKGYQTVVGERGVRLSGGQRQRIGIARALYKGAAVMILDEATSALDNETEASVMQAIEGLDDDITILIIAHRLSTLRTCTQVFELDKGEIVRAGSYGDLTRQPASEAVA
ncbi:ABC transporter ATP-binding protein [Ramlibacter sp.]|uniref:ABC transporter ATP-binding protein n=1 Tax=Ramlibacter sp. TaxID=1917967 RepID=UPI003D0EECCA